MAKTEALKIIEAIDEIILDEPAGYSAEFLKGLKKARDISREIHKSEQARIKEDLAREREARKKEWVEKKKSMELHKDLLREKYGEDYLIKASEEEWELILP